MLRDRAKLFLKRTKFETAVLNSTRRASSWAERSMLWTPSKSNATSKVSFVGVTDIQTPSVVLIALPANEVSTRWFKAKLLPTDCSPMEDTTLTGFITMYDWKIDSYHPNDRLSTIALTSAPSRDFSQSAEVIPSFKGINRFPRITAMCKGMRHRRSTSHSPNRNIDVFHPAPALSLDRKVLKFSALTTVDLSSSPVGFLELRSKDSIRAENREMSFRCSLSETNTSLLFNLPGDVIVCLLMAGTTGNLDHTSLWHSTRQLWLLI